MLIPKIASFFYKVSTVGTFGLIFQMQVLVAQTVDPQKIVAQHFPQSLVDQAKQIGAPTPVGQNDCFVVYESFPNGTPRTIIAGYSNGFGGAIRVIQGQLGGEYSVVFEPSNLVLSGIGCLAELEDVDGDGRNEVRIGFGSMKGNSANWIFKWDGSQLINIAAATKNKQGQLDTDFFNIAFFDFDHDGTLQILSVGEPTPPTDGSLPTEPDIIYHLQNGKYVKEKDILFFRSFIRGKGAPTPQSALDRFLNQAEFSLLQNSTGPYFLRVANGDKDGSHRVSSGHIVVNGVEVAGPNRFNQQVEFFSVPVNLQARNTIQVTLEGKPESQIIVTVEDQGAQQK